jgi:Fe-S-cluster containining protein
MLTRHQNFLSQHAALTLAPCWPKPDPDRVCQAMDQLFAAADAAWQNKRTNVNYLRSAPVAACSAGCGWCCHQQVGISVPEAVRIAAHIAAQPEAERTAFEERVLNTDKRTRGQTTLERAQARIACAFLGVDGRCMIYGVRPLRCRGVYSVDKDFCIACYDDFESMRAKLQDGTLKPAFLEGPEEVFDSALSGVLDVLARFAPKTLVALEMVAAVATLIKDPGMAKRWLAGRAPDAALHLKAEGP